MHSKRILMSGMRYTASTVAADAPLSEQQTQRLFELAGEALQQPCAFGA